MQGNDSRATFDGGRWGMVVGALGGALVFSIASFIGDILMDSGTGGPGLAVMAGAAFGGLLGTIWGSLKARHGGHGAWSGPNRRFAHAVHLGDERRHRL